MQVRAALRPRADAGTITDVIAWQTVQPSVSLINHELAQANIEENYLYKCLVRAFNQALLWSDPPMHSDGFTFDSSAPVGGFSMWMLQVSHQLGSTVRFFVLAFQGLRGVPPTLKRTKGFGAAPARNLGKWNGLRKRWPRALGGRTRLSSRSRTR